MQPLRAITPQESQIIAQLEMHFGLYLEKLNREDKLALRLVLSRYIYYTDFINNYSLEDAITDTMPNVEASICEAILALEGISLRNAELLIGIVTNQQIGFGD